MFAHNLAIVFGPNILKPPAGPGNFMASMSNIGHVSNLVKIFILQVCFFNLLTSRILMSNFLVSLAFLCG